MLQSTIKQFPSSTGIYLPPGASKRGPKHDGVVSVALGQQQATSFDEEQLSFNVILAVLPGLGQLNDRGIRFTDPHIPYSLWYNRVFMPADPGTHRRFHFVQFGCKLLSHACSGRFTHPLPAY